jgi:hypothetical protein
MLLSSISASLERSFAGNLALRAGHCSVRIELHRSPESLLTAIEGGEHDGIGT